MAKVTILGSVAALALSGNVLAADHAVPAISVRHAPVSRIVFPHKGKKILYNQNDNDSGVGVVSQNFEADLDSYDCQGADDFVLEKSVQVSEVDVSGAYFNGEGPAKSFNVTFYSGDVEPGKVVALCKKARYIDMGSGSPNIKCKASLKKDQIYWVSVQANLDYYKGGEWAWNQNKTRRGKLSMWRNPNGGFGTSCTTWTATGVCISELGGDFSFALLGREK